MLNKSFFRQLFSFLVIIGVGLFFALLVGHYNAQMNEESETLEVSFEIVE